MLLFEKLLKSDELKRYPHLREAEFIMIDNVADFFFMSSKSSWDLLSGDFPNIAPPWPIAFYEYRMGPFMRDHYEGNKIYPVHPTVKNTKCGLLMVSSAFSDSDRLEFRSMHNLNVEQSDIGWICRCVTFAASPDLKIFRRMNWFRFHILRCGRIMFATDKKSFFLDRGSFENLKDDLYWLHECTAHLGVELYIPFLANSFCHCKNVEVRRVHPSPQLSKKQEKRYGQPKVSYKILEIHPMREILNREGGLSQHGSLKQALHICRGHFKDYRERGLFGKIKGMYWWDSHVRGSLEKGVAAKDYSVHDS